MKDYLFLMIFLIDGCCLLPINKQPTPEEYGINLKTDQCSKGDVEETNCILNLEEASVSIGIVFITNPKFYPSGYDTDLLFQFITKDVGPYNLEFQNTELFFEKMEVHFVGRRLPSFNEHYYQFALSDAVDLDNGKKLTIAFDLHVKKKKELIDVVSISFFSEEMKEFVKVLQR